MTTEPPTGVVTFLFTDIEGSTELLSRLGSRAAAAFAAHDRIICAAVRRNRGYEVRTEGDSFFIAFERPTDAVTAAVSIQRSISTYPWSPGAPMRVRVGMHSGEADIHGRGYVGLAVHLAARIASAARGGQIMLSRATADLVAAKLMPGVALIDRALVQGLRRPPSDPRTPAPVIGGRAGARRLKRTNPPSAANAIRVKGPVGSFRGF